MAMKGYSALSQSPKLKPYYQMQFSVIPRTFFFWKGLTPLLMELHLTYSKPCWQGKQVQTVAYWYFLDHFNRGGGNPPVAKKKKVHFCLIQFPHFIFTWIWIFFFFLRERERERERESSVHWRRIESISYLFSQHWKILRNHPCF